MAAESDLAPEKLPVTPPAPAAPAGAVVKPVLAADFVSEDEDDLRADDTDESILPEPLADALDGEKPKPGRPRTENPTKEALRGRRRYEKRKTARAAPPSFADLPGGKAPGETPAPAAAPAGPAAPSAPPLKSVNYRANAEGCFMLATGLLAAGVSKEWAPQSEGEKNSVVDPLAAYMEANKWDDISPGWILTFALVAYSVPRLSMPETKEKIAKAAKLMGLSRDDKNQQLQTTE